MGCGGVGGGGGGWGEGRTKDPCHYRLLFELLVSASRVPFLLEGKVFPFFSLSPPTAPLVVCPLCCPGEGRNLTPCGIRQSWRLTSCMGEREGGRAVFWDLGRRTVGMAGGRGRGYFNSLTCWCKQTHILWFPWRFLHGPAKILWPWKARSVEAEKEY